MKISNGHKQKSCYTGQKTLEDLLLLLYTIKCHRNDSDPKTCVALCDRLKFDSGTDYLLPKLTFGKTLKTKKGIGDLFCSEGLCYLNIFRWTETGSCSALNR